MIPEEAITTDRYLPAEVGPTLLRRSTLHQGGPIGEHQGCINVGAALVGFQNEPLAIGRDVVGVALRTAARPSVPRSVRRLPARHLV